MELYNEQYVFCSCGPEALISSTNSDPFLSPIQRGLRVHFIDFPDDLAPMHIDTNFVPLNDNTVMLNPKRPPRPWVLRLLRENGWKTIIGTSNGIPTHPLSHCSEWLSCNVLSIDEKVRPGEERGKRGGRAVVILI